MDYEISPSSSYIVVLAAIGLLFVGLLLLQSNLFLGIVAIAVGLIVIIYYIVKKKNLTIFEVKSKDNKKDK